MKVSEVSVCDAVVNAGAGVPHSGVGVAVDVSVGVVVGVRVVVGSGVSVGKDAGTGVAGV